MELKKNENFEAISVEEMEYNSFDDRISEFISKLLGGERNYAFTYLLQYIATFIFAIVSVYKFGTNCFVEDKYFCIVDFMFLTLWTNIHINKKVY